MTMMSIRPRRSKGCMPRLCLPTDACCRRPLASSACPAPLVYHHRPRGHWRSSWGKALKTLQICSKLSPTLSEAVLCIACIPCVPQTNPNDERARRTQAPTRGPLARSHVHAPTHPRTHALTNHPFIHHPPSVHKPAIHPSVRPSISHPSIQPSIHPSIHRVHPSAIHRVHPSAIHRVHPSIPRGGPARPARGAVK